MESKKGWGEPTWKEDGIIPSMYHYFSKERVGVKNTMVFNQYQMAIDAELSWFVQLHIFVVKSCMTWWQTTMFCIKLWLIWFCLLLKHRKTIWIKTLIKWMQTKTYWWWKCSFQRCWVQILCRCNWWFFNLDSKNIRKPNVNNRCWKSLLWY